MSYGLEVEMIRLAREKDLLTTPYVFSEEEAAAMAEAGADIVVCHLGLTTGGSIGAGVAFSLEDCPARVDAWGRAALAVNPDVLLLVHGGPVSSPGMRSTCSTAPSTATASTAPPRWSGCRRRPRSPGRPGLQGGADRPRGRGR